MEMTDLQFHMNLSNTFWHVHLLDFYKFC
jgi:hypothetical protein